MEDQVKGPIARLDATVPLDKPVTAMAIVDKCYRVVKANGALSGTRACAASRQAVKQGVVRRISM